MQFWVSTTLEGRVGVSWEMKLLKGDGRGREKEFVKRRKNRHKIGDRTFKMVGRKEMSED